MKLNRLSGKLPLPSAIIGAMLFGGVLPVASSAPAVAKEQPAAAAPSRVAAIYFHRTQRCPTCKLISRYIEESLKKGFAEELKSKRVNLYFVDYENPKNKRYKTAYKITGPTLVVVNVRDKKVTRWKPLPKVWSLVTKKKAFVKYVQDGVRGYLEAKK